MARRLVLCAQWFSHALWKAMGRAGVMLFASPQCLALRASWKDTVRDPVSVNDFKRLRWQQDINIWTFWSSVSIRKLHPDLVLSRSVSLLWHWFPRVSVVRMWLQTCFVWSPSPLNTLTTCCWIKCSQDYTLYQTHPPLDVLNGLFSTILGTIVFQSYSM